MIVYLRDDRYDVLLIFGKVEREKIEERQIEFPHKIQENYDNSKIYHDGKWMFIPVADLDTLENVKQLVFVKKMPNLKSFQKENAVYSDFGMRCDLFILAEQ